MSADVGRAGAVVIGRNEGERLKQCLASLSSIAVMVYVDSGSTDGSPQRASADRGAEVVQLEKNLPFTAARARNSDFRRLQDLARNVEYVQFVDGDCEVGADWLSIAASLILIPTLVDCVDVDGNASLNGRFTIGCAIGSGRAKPARYGPAGETS